MRGVRKRAFLALACGAVALLAPAAAQAEIEYQSSFGGAGKFGGKFSTPAGIAVNNANGNVYVADYGQNRVEQFTSSGNFIRAWGYDVVQSGVDNKPFADEVDEVRIRATSGSFSLIFKGEETAQIPFNATAGEVETALNGLTTVNTGGGSVTVTGGPGDVTGAHPYVVTFGGGPLAHEDLELGIEPSGLGVPPGTQLSCLGSGGETEFSIPADAIEYQWLANGTPVSGATSPAFTPGSEQEGKTIQCQVTATFGTVKTTTASHPYLIASPAPLQLPPLGPASLAKPEGEAVVESVGGNSLICHAGSWARNPETFTYQWYGNGTPIGSPVTSTETSNEYFLTAADVANRALFQCAVTGANAGGASTAFSQVLKSNPSPKLFREATAAVRPALNGRSSVLIRTNGGAVLEVCSASAGDECKSGVAGRGAGQLDRPRSVAVDNSAAGEHAVYVIDDGNARVQKFSSEGNLLLGFGREVNETTGGNVCVAASGDVCGPGIRATDPTSAGFGTSGTGAQFAELGNDLGVDPAGNVYVGDPRGGGGEGRVQKFDSGGNFLAQAEVPHNPAFGSGRPISLAVDSAQRSYVTTQGGVGAGVIRTLPNEYSLTGNGTQLGGNLFDQDRNAAQLALDPRNDRILVSDFNSLETVSVCGGPPVAGHAIIEFDPQLNEIDCTVPSGLGSLGEVTGMAVSPAGRLFASTGSSDSIKIFKLPVPSAPTVGVESVTNITTESARLHAQINPGFEATTFEVEYGTEPCPSPSCKSVAGASALHGLKFVDGATPVSGLTPDTAYHYRVIAENPRGTVEGPDRTFTTFAKVDLTNDPCPNALARKQTKTAGLLDCRAYELASAAFAGGYDVESNLVQGQSPFDLYPDASGKLLYGVHEGGIPGTGVPTNRGLDPYVATRGEDGTWSTKYVGIPADNPFATEPFSSILAGADSGLSTFAFGGDICDHCFEDGSSGVPVRLPNGELVQGMAGEGSHPSASTDGYIAKPLSANGEHLIFGSTTRFAEGGNEESGDVSLYDRNLKTGETHVVSNTPAGEDFPEPLPCLQGAGQCHSPGDGNGIAELDLSKDGSRILVAQKTAEDAKGNPLWHLYLNLNDSVRSIDLMPGATEGAYFDGMSADGTRVFFTTTEQLLSEDEDESADIYEAEVSAEGSFSLRLVSVNSDGSPSNSDACNPSNEPASWNVPTGEGKCGALAFAGGAGVAEGSGSFYFLSPEQLESGKGTADQPNLYYVAPGADPKFVATIDTSEGKPGPLPPTHPLVSSSFAGKSFEAVEALGVDQSNGDLYAIDAAEGKVYRYHANGTPHDFSAGPHEGNALTGFSFGVFSEAGVAIDNHASSPLEGDIYLASEAGVGVFAPSGEQLGLLEGSSTNNGEFGNACGVAVDQSSGTLYVADKAGYIWQYTPNSPTGEITDADYTVKGLKTEGIAPCAIAVDSAGHVYAAKASDGPVAQFSTASLASGSPPKVAGTEIDGAAKALAVDSQTNHLFVDEGNRISVFDSSASGKAIETIGAGKLSCGFLGSRGVAVNETTHHVYASCFEPSVVKEFGYQVPPYTPVDDPAILHAAHPLAHSYGDFQVTPQGKYAIFTSSMPLQEGFDNASHYEVYRYGSEGGELLCASCSPTGAQPQSDAALPPNGLGVLEDGRVFFNSGEELTLSDTNGKPDAYEFSPQREGSGGCKRSGGCQQLISTGTSAFPSGLLGVSRDGTDAFFFTRDVLVGEDENGNAMKVYDARTNGGHFVIPPPPPCAASDECHGPGTKAAAPPSIGTFKGSGGQYSTLHCKKPKVKRRGHCIKPHKPRHHKHRHHHKRRHKAKHRRGGRR